MKIYNKLLLSALVVMSISSCTKTADVDIPDNEPELVVASFISPQNDSAKVKLSWSKPIYYNTGYDTEFEGDATVTVSNGSNSYLLTYSDTEKEYISDHIGFNVGDELKLRITHDGKEFTSECKIPAEPKYEIEYLGGMYDYSNGYADYYHKVKLVCNNTQGINYYRLVFDFHTNEEYYYYGASIAIIKMSNGESKEFLLYGDWENTADSLSIYIINADENYFRYHETVQRQSEGDDFFTEPGIIYNNIEGGIGVFSAYNQKKEVFILD